jgi:hypothetical protein
MTPQLARLIFATAHTTEQCKRLLHILKWLRPPVTIKRLYWRAYRHRISALERVKSEHNEN